MVQSLFGRLFPGEIHHTQGMVDELKLRLPGQGRALDLGCGINLDLASYRSAQVEIWGTDFQKHPQLKYPEWFRTLAADGSIPFPDGYFDVVSSVMVLEHVKQPEQFFREIHRVLRPNGFFIGHSISGKHYVTWIRRLIGLLPHRINQSIVKRLYGRSPEDTFPTYYRANQYHQIKNECGKTGLTLTTMKHYADPSYFRFSALLESAAIISDWSLEKLGEGWGRLYFTVTLQKTSASNMHAA